MLQAEPPLFRRKDERLQKGCESAPAHQQNIVLPEYAQPDGRFYKAVHRKKQRLPLQCFLRQESRACSFPLYFLALYLQRCRLFCQNHIPLQVKLQVPACEPCAEKQHHSALIRVHPALLQAASFSEPRPYRQKKQQRLYNCLYQNQETLFTP